MKIKNNWQSLPVPWLLQGLKIGPSSLGVPYKMMMGKQAAWHFSSHLLFHSPTGHDHICPGGQTSKPLDGTFAREKTAGSGHALLVNDRTAAPLQHSRLQGVWVRNMKTNPRSCFLHVPTAAAGSGFSALCCSKSTSKGGQKQLNALLFI